MVLPFTCRTWQSFISAMYTVISAMYTVISAMYTVPDDGTASSEGS
jgi:hypothetical protein